MWMEEFSRSADVTILDDRVRISNVRDFSWDNHGLVKKRWITRTIGPEDLKAVHLVTEQFRTWGAAHTLLCFETDLDPICVSIEARRHEGQAFSLVKGLFGAFELFYLYGTAADLLGQRLDAKGRELDVGKLVLSAEKRWGLFENLARRAHENAKEPENYHTLKRNCATDLARAFPQDVRAPILPKNLAFILMQEGIAEPNDIYDAQDRPPFLA